MVQAPPRRVSPQCYCVHGLFFHSSRIVSGATISGIPPNLKVVRRKRCSCAHAHPVSPCTSGSECLRQLRCLSRSVEHRHRYKAEHSCLLRCIHAATQSASSRPIHFCCTDSKTRSLTLSCHWRHELELLSRHSQARSNIAGIIGSRCRRTSWCSKPSPRLLQGMYTETEALYLRAIGIKEKVLGPDHHTVATTLNNLAELYRVQVRVVFSLCLWLVNVWFDIGIAEGRGCLLGHLLRNIIRFQLR